LIKDNCQCRSQRESASKQKDLLCVWWNYEGLIYYELVPDGRTINAEVYSNKLEKIYTVLLEEYPALVNRKLVLLQQENAQHTAKKTLQKIEELEGIELLPNPAFSPDLEPSGYYLFRSMAQFLRGKKLQSVADVEVAVAEFLLPKIKSGFTRHSRNLLKNG
jgi:histone-lysine N-methyltransferase SETMAR